MLHSWVLPCFTSLSTKEWSATGYRLGWHSAQHHCNDRNSMKQRHAARPSQVCTWDSAMNRGWIDGESTAQRQDRKDRESALEPSSDTDPVDETTDTLALDSTWSPRPRNHRHDMSWHELTSLEVFCEVRDSWSHAGTSGKNISRIPGLNFQH